MNPRQNHSLPPRPNFAAASGGAGPSRAGGNHHNNTGGVNHGGGGGGGGSGGYPTQGFNTTNSGGYPFGTPLPGYNGNVSGGYPSYGYQSYGYAYPQQGYGAGGYNYAAAAPQHNAYAYGTVPQNQQQQQQHAAPPPPTVPAKRRAPPPSSSAMPSHKPWRNCSHPGCKYTGSGEDVEIHEGDRHLIFPNGKPVERSEEEERYLKSLNGVAPTIQGTGIKLETEEEIAKWIEERKRKWPTKKRAEEKVRMVVSSCDLVPAGRGCVHAPFRELTVRPTKMRQPSRAARTRTSANDHWTPPVPPRNGDASLPPSSSAVPPTVVVVGAVDAAVVRPQVVASASPRGRTRRPTAPRLPPTPRLPLGPHWCPTPRARLATLARHPLPLTRIRPTRTRTLMPTSPLRPRPSPQPQPHQRRLRIPAQSASSLRVPAGAATAPSVGSHTPDPTLPGRRAVP